jgi:predicted CoA-binding protein
MLRNASNGFSDVVVKPRRQRHERLANVSYSTISRVDEAVDFMDHAFTR